MRRTRLSPGHEVSHYILNYRLGAGGMAEVWAATHRVLGVQVALKVLFDAGPSVQQRLIREGRVQASLDHPNLLPVRDAIEVHGTVSLVLPLIEGPSLERLLATYRLSEAEAVALFRGIVSGVAYAHENGLIHRDLKPANVLMDTRKNPLQPRVSDFGLVKDSADIGQTRSGAVMGTLHYAAPEQLLDAASVDHRADVFSLGVIFVELLTGRRPYPGVSLKEKLAAYQDAPELDGVPERWEAVCLALLDPDPEYRTESCVALLAEVDAVAKASSPELLMAGSPVAKAARRLWEGMASETMDGARPTAPTASVPVAVIHRRSPSSEPFGRPLTALLAQQTFPQQQASLLGERIIRAVLDLHAAGTVHGHLSPSTIRVGDGNIVVLDMAQAGQPYLDEASRSTPPIYRAPEAVVGAALDVRADIFSLGCVLYELLCGRAAFPTVSQGAAAPPTRHRPVLPAHQVEAVMKALSARPDDRQQQAWELLTSWTGLPSEMLSSSTLSTQKATAWWSRPPVRTWLLVALIAVLIGGVAVNALSGPTIPNAPESLWNPENQAILKNRLLDTQIPHAERVWERVFEEFTKKHTQRQALREELAWRIRREPDASEPRRLLDNVDIQQIRSNAKVRTLLERDPAQVVDHYITNLPRKDESLLLSSVSTGVDSQLSRLPRDPVLREQALMLYPRGKICQTFQFAGDNDRYDSCLKDLAAAAEKMPHDPVRVEILTQVLFFRLNGTGYQSTVDQRSQLQLLTAEANMLRLEPVLARLYEIAVRVKLSAVDPSGPPAEPLELLQFRRLVERLNFSYDEHVRLRQLEARLAAARGEWGKRSILMAQYRELVLQRYGSDSARYAWVLHEVAGAQFDAGEVEVALENSRRAAALYRAQLGETHPEQYYSRVMLAEMLLLLYRTDEVFEVLEGLTPLMVRHTDPYRARILILQARAAMLSEDIEKTKQIVEGLSELDAKRRAVDTSAIRGAIAAASGDPGPARAWLAENTQAPVCLREDAAQALEAGEAILPAFAPLANTTRWTWRCSSQVACPETFRCCSDVCVPLPPAQRRDVP